MDAQDEQLLESLYVKTEELERLVSDINQRLDTLQTPLWKRALFRLDGWTGQSNLNAERPAWRPWRRWWTS